MSVFLIDFRFSLLVLGFVSFHLLCFDFPRHSHSDKLPISLLSDLLSLSLSPSLAFLSHASVSLSTIKKVFIWLCRVRRVRGCQTMRRRWNNTAKCIESGEGKGEWDEGDSSRDWSAGRQAALAAHLGLPVQAEVAVYTIVIFRKSGRDEDATPHAPPSFTTTPPLAQIFGRWPLRRLQGVVKFSFRSWFILMKGKYYLPKCSGSSSSRNFIITQTTWISHSQRRVLSYKISIMIMSNGGKHNDYNEKWRKSTAS